MVSKQCSDRLKVRYTKYKKEEKKKLKREMKIVKRL